MSDETTIPAAWHNDATHAPDHVPLELVNRALGETLRRRIDYIWRFQAAQAQASERGGSVIAYRARDGAIAYCLTMHSAPRDFADLAELEAHLEQITRRKLYRVPTLPKREDAAPAPESSGSLIS
jgi:hypothetical protein